MPSEQQPRIRERQAELTRNEILLAARRLFAERGFTRTSVRDIAQAAGVSAQTVYDSIGSKSAVVARLNDLIDTEAGIGAIVGTVVASRDPQQVAALSARITRSMPRTAETSSARSSPGRPRSPTSRPSSTKVTADTSRAPAPSSRRFWTWRGVARPAEADSASETLAAITDFRFAVVLRESYDWSLDRIEEWMTTASRDLLLG